MPRPSTGELRPLSDGTYEARVTIEGRARKGFKLTACRTQGEAIGRCKAMAEMAKRVRAAGFADHLVALLEQAATARSGRSWDAVASAVNTLCSGNVEDIGHAKVPTFEDFAKEWTSGDLARKFPDHVSTKNAVHDVQILTRYVYPCVRNLLVSEFTLTDADRIMANLPDVSKATGRPLSTSTRRHVAQAVRRVLTLAVYPARLIKENPIPRGWLPKVKMTKALTHLYPEEDRALISCPAVPVIRRLFYGVLDREGMRREELARLRWRDVDLVRGIVTLDENKTDDPRAWALDPGVARALAAWKKRREGVQPDEHVFTDEAGARLDVEHLARVLRADLVTAKVDRPQLFERSESRRPIRAHDLRSTFITVSLANGKSETWVADRTGHRSSIMINRYRRAARKGTDVGLGALAPLGEILFGLGSEPGLPQDKPQESPRPLGGTVYAGDLKSSVRKGVRVRVPEGPPSTAGRSGNQPVTSVTTSP